MRLSNEIARQLDSLAQSDQATLRDLWRQHFGRSPSEQMRRDMLVRVLAYTIQERALGRGLAPRRRNRQLIGENIKNSGAMTVQIEPGTKLIREYQGQMHNVIVAERGYEYRGQLHGSLSKIARLITGGSWSGPVFFGLKSGKKPPAKRSNDGS
ncbi:MAG: DUF2924 domain-containing protein [Candidatus Angelobacter sp.]